MKQSDESSISQPVLSLTHQHTYTQDLHESAATPSGILEDELDLSDNNDEYALSGETVCEGRFYKVIRQR